jgi:hypothetical protein
MKILAIEKEIEGKEKRDFEKHLKSEALKVWQLITDDIIREIYFDKEKNTAVLVLECNSKKEAENILKDLPLVKENLITFELLHLIPYTGFERLFT